MKLWASQTERQWRLVVSKGIETLRLRLLVHESASGLARKNEPRKVITKTSLRAFICLIIMQVVSV